MFIRSLSPATNLGPNGKIGNTLNIKQLIIVFFYMNEIFSNS